MSNDGLTNGGIVQYVSVSHVPIHLNRFNLKRALRGRVPDSQRPMEYWSILYTSPQCTLQKGRDVERPFLMILFSANVFMMVSNSLSYVTFWRTYVHRRILVDETEDGGLVLEAACHDCRWCRHKKARGVKSKCALTFVYRHWSESQQLFK